MLVSMFEDRVADPVRGNEVELRLSELLSGLSHALDITEGQPRGHAERSCLIGMRLGAELGLDDDTRSSIFYALLLKDAGCSSNAAKIAALFAADDATVKRTRRLTDSDSTWQALAHIVRTTAPGCPPLARARRVGALIRLGRAGASSLVALRCDRGAAVARAIGLDETTARAILELDEHWDGRGYPTGLYHDQISLGGRLLCLAQTAEVFWRRGGSEAACGIARRRRGRWFDPDLVDALLALEEDDEFWRSIANPDVSLWEPPDRVLIADQVAATLDLSPDSRATLRRAALLHDLGKLGVSSRILDKPGPLTEPEWEVMRCHPRWSMEILTRVRAFRELARIAALHHERLDGSGYVAGLTADDLDLPARILAVADVAEALGADRPYRRALDVDEVLEIMRGDVGRKLDADAFGALEDVLPALRLADAERSRPRQGSRRRSAS